MRTLPTTTSSPCRHISSLYILCNRVEHVGFFVCCKTSHTGFFFYVCLLRNLSPRLFFFFSIPYRAQELPMDPVDYICVSKLLRSSVTTAALPAGTSSAPDKAEEDKQQQQSGGSVPFLGAAPGVSSLLTASSASIAAATPSTASISPSQPSSTSSSSSASHPAPSSSSSSSSSPSAPTAKPSKRKLVCLLWNYRVFLGARVRK